MNELMTVLHISTIFACIFHHEIYLHFTFHREMYTYKYTYKRNQTTLDGILMICALSCSQFAQFVHLFSVNNMTTWKRVNKCSGNTGRAREAKIEGESKKKSQSLWKWLCYPHFGMTRRAPQIWKAPNEMRWTTTTVNRTNIAHSTRSLFAVPTSFPSECKQF